MLEHIDDTRMLSAFFSYLRSVAGSEFRRMAKLCWLPRIVGVHGVSTGGMGDEGILVE